MKTIINDWGNNYQRIVSRCDLAAYVTKYFYINLFTAIVLPQLRKAAFSRVERIPRSEISLGSGEILLIKLSLSRRTPPGLLNAATAAIALLGGTRTLRGPATASSRHLSPVYLPLGSDLLADTPADSIQTRSFGVRPLCGRFFEPMKHASVELARTLLDERFAFGWGLIYRANCFLISSGMQFVGIRSSSVEVLSHTKANGGLNRSTMHWSILRSSVYPVIPLLHPR